MATTLNEISFQSKIVSAAKKRQFVGLARSATNTQVVFAQADLLREFDKHQVTKELLQDPSEPGSELVDHGNLVSFIGLEDGVSEVNTLREIFEDEIKLSADQPIITSTKNRINYKFRIQTPNKEDIYARFPTPDGWSSRSWLELIEKGISNAASYIFSSTGFSFGESRSGTGLQIKDKSGKPRQRAAGGYFEPMKYISDLLKKFRERFR